MPAVRRSFVGASAARAAQVASRRWEGAGRRVRAGYLWYFAAIGAFTPFATLYYRDLGMSGLQVGVLAALPALAAALAGPLWGAVTDARALHRPVLAGALATAALAGLALTQLETFGPILLLTGLLSFSLAPVAAILDGYAVTVGERLGRSYGSLRVWGSVGYTAAAFAAGRLMGERVSPLFLVACAVCLGLALLSVLRLPPMTERSARPLLAGLGLLVRDRPLALLLLMAYLISSSAAVMYGFLGIHLQGLGGSAGLLGLAVAIGAASEFPVVAFGGRLLDRLGAPRLIALAMAVYAARFAAYAALPGAAWVIPVQLFHGLSYGAFLVASVTLAHRLAGREHAATAQALLTAMSFGFGSITGSLVGGALLDHVGTVGLFRGAAAAMVLTLGVFLVGARAVGFGDGGPDPVVGSAGSGRRPG